MSSAANETDLSTTDQPLSLEPAWPPAACDVEDLLMAWRDASHDLRLAHHDWREAARDARRDAYVAVVAAADREAVAAETLSRITRASSSLSPQEATTSTSQER
jgi:hypothetical protein